MGEIIIGLDLTPAARAALTWAAEQARTTGQIVRAVNAVDISADFNMALGMGEVAVPIDPSAMDAAYRTAITDVFDSIHPGLGWRLQFFSGEAGPVLVTQSVGAALLVLGTKQHVGIDRLISGSVSHYCLSHAQCPVVAVPAGNHHDTKKDHDHHPAAADAEART